MPRSLRKCDTKAAVDVLLLKIKAENFKKTYLENRFKKLLLVDRLFKEIGFKRQSGNTFTQFNSFAIVFSTDGYDLAIALFIK